MRASKNRKINTSFSVNANIITLDQVTVSSLDRPIVLMQKRQCLVRSYFSGGSRIVKLGEPKWSQH